MGDIVRAQLRRAAPLGLLWLASVLPLLLYVLLVQQSVGAIFSTVGQLTLACVIALLPLRLPGHPRGLRWLLFGALALCIMAGIAERELSRNDWQVSDKAGLFSALRGGDTVQKVGFRSWEAAGLDQATFSMEARLLTGTPGWDWYRSNTRFQLEPLESGGIPFTRVHVPEKTEDEGQPYLMRTFDTRESLEGRIFKVIFDIRRAPPSGVDRIPNEKPPMQRGEPIGGRDCIGMLLQAWNERGGGRCLPLTLTDDWRRYSLSWRVPEAIDPEAHVVRVLVQGFGGETLDLRRVLLYRGLVNLGPPNPQGVAVQVTWGAQSESHSGFSFVPQRDWQSVKLPITKEPNPSDTLSVQLSAGEGVLLQTRHVVVRDPMGTPLAKAVSSNRQTIIFGDPNLAGHTLGTLGLAFVSLASPLWGALGGFLSLFSMLLTGSRAALVGLVAGLLWLAWSWLPPKRRVGLALLTSLGTGGVLLLAQVWPPLASLRLLNLNEVTARSDIWAAAWEAFRAHPWQGLGAGGFSRYWATNHGGEAVQHAHNFWLEAAASYGILGLISALALALGLLVLAARWGGVRALALVVGVLVMNVFDTTLTYTGVLLTLMLGLAIFKPPLRLLQAGARQNAHNTAVAASQVPQAPNE